MRLCDNMTSADRTITVVIAIFVLDLVTVNTALGRRLLKIAVIWRRNVFLWQQRCRKGMTRYGANLLMMRSNLSLIMNVRLFIESLRYNSMWINAMSLNYGDNLKIKSKHENSQSFCGY